MKVVNDISRVAASEVGHWHADLLVVIVQVDANVFLYLLPSEQRGEQGVLVHHPTVEQTVLWDLGKKAERFIIGHLN